MKQYKWVIGAVFLFLSFFTLSSSVSAASSQYQKCNKGTNCTVGEFLYDDEYTPIATASCTLTSRDTGGAILLNSVVMTPHTDGWYDYSIPTADKTEGLYRTQMCCTTSSEYLCLDRSFYIDAATSSASISKTDIENAVWDSKTASHGAVGTFGSNLQNPTLTASDIWGYANRTLTGYGNLISDIWGYSTRSLTSFGSLIADIWSSTSRTLSSSFLASGGQLSTAETVEKTSYTAVNTVEDQNGNKNVTDTVSFGQDSFIFHITVTNPSSLISQKVPFTYYFPSEIKKVHILSSEIEDVDLSTSSNVLSASNHSSYSVSGEVLLAPSASKMFTVVTKDVWTLSKDEIHVVGARAAVLFEPLKKTSYFAQGATLKSDIDAHLERASSIQKNPLNPKEKITNYRLALIEYNSAKTKTDNLKTLVATAGSAGSLMGYIGGVQVFAVWGLVIVFVSGFVFLALYMKNLNSDSSLSKDEKKNKSRLITGTFSENRDSLFNHNLLKYLVFGLVIGGGVLFGLFSLSKTHATAEKKDDVVPPIAQTIISTPTIMPLGTTPPPISIEKKIKITEDSLNVRENPGATFKKIAIVKKGSEYTSLSQQKDLDGAVWINIKVDEKKAGWVLAQYTSQAIESAVLGVQATTGTVISIIVPEGEVVVVRDGPSLTGKKIMTLNATIQTQKFEEMSGWVKTTEGWVPGIYIQETTK